MITIQQEKVEVWEKDCMPLVVEHWKELGLDLDLEIAPDFESMKWLEKVGKWAVISVRDDGKLVGYLLAVINTHLHYRTSPKMFIIDAYYIAPQYRNGTGARLIRFAEKFARQVGAIKMYLTCKCHKDHSALFLKMGYRLSDLAFTRRL